MSAFFSNLRSSRAANVFRQALEATVSHGFYLVAHQSRSPQFSPAEQSPLLAHNGAAVEQPAGG